MGSHRLSRPRRLIVALLGVLLFLDDKDQIQYMVAPDLRYNKTTGVFPALRFFGYPSPERRYSVVVAKSTTRDEDYELEYTDRSFWEGRGFLLASFLHEADSTERFFGFGNESPEERPHPDRDRKSTRLNSSHSQISYAVFCLKKKKKKNFRYFHSKKKTKKETSE